MAGLWPWSDARAQGMMSFDALGDQKMELSADDLTCDEKRCDLIGNVKMITGTTLLSARALQIDFETGEDGKRRVIGARASGDVLLIDGNAMTACEMVELGPTWCKARCPSPRSA